MDLSIIIVSNNHENYVKELLKSFKIIESKYSYEIILVDNFSSDNLCEYVKNEYSNVILLPQRVKRGFSANNNIGIRKASGRYIMLLNPDTLIIEKDTVDKLIEYMDENCEVGCVGPMLVNGDDTLQLSVRKFPTISSTIYRRTPLRKLFKNNKANDRFLMANEDHSITKAVDWMLGAALVLRRDVIEQLGGLDERYFLYCEDIDLCYNVKRLGYKVVYFPGVLIKHYLQESSFKKFIDKKTLWHYKSMFKYILKNKFKYNIDKKYI